MLEELWNTARRSLRPLRHIGWLRSSVYFANVLINRIGTDPWSKERFDREYAARPDPWDYDTEEGSVRLVRAAQLLDTLTNGRLFSNALEIGCAEGAFTQLLVERCETILAVDFSQIALKRASQRGNWGGRVKFEQFDLRRQQLNGNFDLVVLMDVLDCFPTRDVKKACEKVLGCLPNRGFLLMSAVKQADVFDTAWWSKWIIVGGQRVKRYLVEHARLKLVADAELDTHVIAVFEKT
jgi:predicted TPR repeat methyltransferase